ncbi:MAG: HD-GYP domain-containing protein [Neptuniibacter sp.]
MDQLIFTTNNTDLFEQVQTALAGDFQLNRSSDLLDSHLDQTNILDIEVLDRTPKNRIQQLIDSDFPIFLTWKNEGEDQRQFAFDQGFDDFLAPPFFHNVVTSKIRIHQSLANLKQSGDFISVQRKQAKSNFDCEHDHDFQVIQDAAILSLATIARIRDHSTGNHILRTQHYVKALAEFLKNKEPYKSELDRNTIELFYKTAALHDIGKVGIPDKILQKPEKLTEEEYELMKQHTILGFKAIHSAELLVQREVSGQAAKFLTIAKQVTLSHHERWDGNGYPQGLKAENIPIVARLMAVADVYDAMISRRPYKGEMDHESAAEAIIHGSGSHFDPCVVEAFVALQETFKHISVKLEDHFPSEADLSLHSMADLILELDSKTV